MSEKVRSVDESPTNIGSDPVFEVRDLSVYFDMDRGQSRVIDEVSIDIEREEIIGVVGESGSGKSMFASALLDAVVSPGKVAGDITYNPPKGESTDVLDQSPGALRRFRWEEVAMVFQGAISSFNPTMTFRGHFEETLEYHGYDMEDGMEHARDLIETLHLDPDRTLDSYPHELSGGMRQRMLIALSLVLDPEVLVMDEPTAALDLLMQRSILSLIHDLKEEYGLTVVFITHDLPLIASLADRLAVLYAFEFIEVGPAQEVKTNAKHPYMRSLLRAVPSIDSPIEDMRPIQGATPDPVNVPAGCSYNPRCPLASEECRMQDPSLEEVEAGHQVSCFHWEDSADEFPLMEGDE